ncbi:HlyC/CorC family transporter [archaeon]|jgi:putative hemolysin|nr:HlyC/CorC family transporter [archaeon]
MLQNQIILLITFLLLSGFFSGIETAFMSISRIKVKSLLNQKRKGAKTLAKLKENHHKLIITILIGNNVVNIAAASLATVIFSQIFSSSVIGISTGIMTVLILIFGEITPKTIAASRAEKISLATAPLIYWLSVMLSPLVWLFEKFSRGINRILGVQGEEKLSEEELETVVTMGRKEGILEKEAAEMMHNVIKFGETTAREVMTPSVTMVMIDGNKKINDVIDFIVKTPYSRYPVYSGDENNIVGILDIDDVLKQVKLKKLSTPVKKIVRPVSFIPETKEIDDLLTELEGKEVPMAMVVDEYGEIEGLITVEDILEEIVGDIFDKSKTKGLNLDKTKNSIMVDARTSIDEINKALELGIDGQHFTTIGGYMTEKMGRIPRVGEKMKLRKVTLEVRRATVREIKRIKISKN